LSVRSDVLRASIIAMLGVACASTPRRLDPASFDLQPKILAQRGASDHLIALLRRDAFAYFRMLGEPFELRTCAAFDDLRTKLPLTPLIGDAHLEQFAVSERSYGLDDFDRGGFGPAVVDLVRYGASLHLACQQVGFRCNSDEAIARMLEAYRGALLTAPPRDEPDVTVRMRARVGPRTGWLDQMQRSMFTLAPKVEQHVRALWGQHVRSTGELTMSIVAVGGLRSGVGSATAKRALLRLSGATDDPADDLAIELRYGGTPSARATCVVRAPDEQVAVLAMSMIRREMPPVYGFFLGTNRGWFQAWDPTYVELILEDLTSQRDLDQLATDAGRQLAEQGWMWVPEPVRGGQRSAQLIAFDLTRPRVLALAKNLARDATLAWKRFVTAR
jgi:uncharacterized protein DUF2252